MIGLSAAFTNSLIGALCVENEVLNVVAASKIGAAQNVRSRRSHSSLAVHSGLNGRKRGAKVDGRVVWIVVVSEEAINARALHVDVDEHFVLNGRKDRIASIRIVGKVGLVDRVADRFVAGESTRLGLVLELPRARKIMVFDRLVAAEAFDTRLAPAHAK